MSNVLARVSAALAAAVTILALLTAPRAEVASVPTVPNLDITTEAPICSSRIVAVGDLDGSGLVATGRLAVAANPDHVVLLGDLAYPDGRAGDFRELMGDPSWTALRPKTVTLPGNHEYHTTGASEFWKRFPEPLPRVVDVGCGWRLFAINSERGVTAQTAWVKAQLATPGPVIVAMHKPVKSSGRHGPTASLKPIWDLLKGRVSIVLSGHDHDAERFKRSYNRLQIVSGLGGATYRSFGTIRTGSAYRLSKRAAIWQAILHADGSYDRAFLTTSGPRDVGVNRPY